MAPAEPIPLPFPNTQPPKPSRRDFLRKSARVSLGIGLGLSSLDWLSGCAPVLDHQLAPWNDLATQLQGSLLQPGTTNFSQTATPWALQYASTKPQAIALCASEADVVACIRWARANQMPLVARSGGHSYGGYSLTTGLMIAVSPMQTFAYDPASGRATVGAGARNLTVFNAGKKMGIAIPHGRCFEVGVAGLVLGGGIGFDMRQHGLTCDSLLETRIALADGRVLTCNEQENADLFWACRGAGGGNFGIHTSFTFQTFPVNPVTVFSLVWTNRIAETFAAIESMNQTAPNALGIKVSVTATKQGKSTALSLAILGHFSGSEADLRALLAPVLAVQTPTSQTITTMPYWDGQDFLSEEGSPTYAHERSRFMSSHLTPDAIQLILSSLANWPGTSREATWKYFLLGGEIDKKAPADMAFVHRGYAMLSSIELEWDPVVDADVLAANQQWLSDFHARMSPYASGASYQNFIDPSQENYLDAYYGSNLPQLKAIKRKYDPTNLFNYPQSIPLT